MMQNVRKAQTQSGQYGYFTGGYLAWSLSREQFELSDEWHIEHCKLLGFNYE
jgi:hypothetical protein